MAVLEYQHSLCGKLSLYYSWAAQPLSNTQLWALSLHQVIHFGSQPTNYQSYTNKTIKRRQEQLAKQGWTGVYNQKWSRYTKQKIPFVARYIIVCITHQKKLKMHFSVRINTWQFVEISRECLHQPQQGDAHKDQHSRIQCYWSFQTRLSDSSTRLLPQSHWPLQNTKLWTGGCIGSYWIWKDQFRSMAVSMCIDTCAFSEIRLTQVSTFVILLDDIFILLRFLMAVVVHSGLLCFQQFGFGARQVSRESEVTASPAQTWLHWFSISARKE